MNDYIKREDAIENIDELYFSDKDDHDRTREAIKRLSAVDVVEADKAQKEIDYWHDKAQIYEQTILKLSLNKADVVEVVRCKDCKYAEVADPEDSQDGYTCQFHRGSIWFSGSYCSWAERRNNE